MKNFFSSRFGKIIIFTVLGLSAYFINVEVQSYFGRQALEKTGLQRFTLDEALTKATAENKQVLVDVSAIWCPNCRRLDNDVFANESVKKVINEKFVFARLEYESPEGTEFLEKHNTNGFPNLWLLDNKGNAIKQLRVTFNAEEFIKQLQ
jgi:thiol:disulfide interchange protein